SNFGCPGAESRDELTAENQRGDTSWPHPRRRVVHRTEQQVDAVMSGRQSEVNLRQIARRGRACRNLVKYLDWTRFVSHAFQVLSTACCLVLPAARNWESPH